MEHSEIESLLGAYALDALDRDEAAVVEQHLLSCPRCREEVEAHREVAGLIGNAGSDAPEGLWEKIASQLEQDPSSEHADDLIIQLRSSAQKNKTKRRFVAAGGFLGAVAAAVVVVLALQISHLSDQVHHDQAQSSSVGIAAAAEVVLSKPHQTINLDAPASSRHARIVLAPDGEAYWIDSNLSDLKPTSTYQLWTVADGRVVSLGLIGSDPRKISVFRLEPDMTRLMVTAEPEGGASVPTFPVVVQAKVAI